MSLPKDDTAPLDSPPPPLIPFVVPLADYFDRSFCFRCTLVALPPLLVISFASGLWACIDQFWAEKPAAADLKGRHWPLEISDYCAGARLNKWSHVGIAIFVSMACLFIALFAVLLCARIAVLQRMPTSRPMAARFAFGGSLALGAIACIFLVLTSAVPITTKDDGYFSSTDDDHKTNQLHDDVASLTFVFLHLCEVADFVALALLRSKGLVCASHGVVAIGALTLTWHGLCVLLTLAALITHVTGTTCWCIPWEVVHVSEYLIVASALSYFLPFSWMVLSATPHPDVSVPVASESTPLKGPA